MRDFYAHCDYVCLYTLAAREKGRVSVQLLHEDDPCCFAGRDRHDDILAYNHAVRSMLGEGQGWFSTAIVDWNKHEYSPRDRVVISAAWKAYAAGANVSAYDELPCDILRAASIPCYA